jgi:hypothetical protein
MAIMLGIEGENKSLAAIPVGLTLAVGLKVKASCSTCLEVDKRS